MTGTAETEAGEFWEIYKLDVVVIPTNEAVRRFDYEDYVYKTRKEKYNAILDEIDEVHQQGRPVLVGTVSVEVSETLSRMLKRRGINHNVLNAKYHQQEAEIVAEAGRKGAVTIATNMAGRGTDIKLGQGTTWLGGTEPDETSAGEPAPPGTHKEKLAGGLHIVGTERHEARRIDRQLRGRSGRQGDPGSSRFFLSLEDDLMRLFGSDRIAGMMDRLGVQEGEVITHPFVTKAIERAQKRVEGHHFETRKHLLEYDNVMNQQREVVYNLRNEALEQADISARIRELVEHKIDALVEAHAGSGQSREGWDLAGLEGDLQSLLLGPVELRRFAEDGGTWEELRDAAQEAARAAYARREEMFGPERMREIERRVQLMVLDEKWRDHLYEIDQLRGGIGLRAYGQRDPLLEYKQEAFRMFEELVTAIEEDTVRFLFRVRPAPAAGPARPPAGLAARQPVAAGAMRAQHAGAASAFGAPTVAGTGVRSAAAPTAAGRTATLAQGPPRPSGPPPGTPQRTVVRAQPKIGRNEPCPCGSGKKYKKCCGVNA
jgi:preprotein translocase subunit SecA